VAVAVEPSALRVQHSRAVVVAALVSMDKVLMALQVLERVVEVEVALMAQLALLQASQGHMVAEVVALQLVQAWVHQVLVERY
jgi:hypothetical protein